VVDTTPAEAPRHAVRAAQRAAVGTEAGQLDPETVQAVAAVGECCHDRLARGGVLSAADGPDAHERLVSERDAVRLVEVSTPEVILGRPALEDRDDRQLGRELAEQEQVGDGAALMLGHGEAGPGEHGRFVHPVLRRRPGEHPHLVAVAADGGDVRRW
jgi:hypothetical protein